MTNLSRFRLLRSLQRTAGAAAEAQRCGLMLSSSEVAETQARGR